MKKDIHPLFYDDAQVKCACGNSFVTGSTQKTISVDVCNKCHPLYTGEHRYIDVKGKVESFEKKRQIGKNYQAKKIEKKHKKNQKGDKQLKSLKELLGEV